MDKAELIGATLDRLIDHFRISPESFEFTDNGVPTVSWRPKIVMDDVTSSLVCDPNNAHAVVVRYLPMTGEVVCYLFLSAPEGDPINSTHKADSSISSKRPFETYRGNYRKLMTLKTLVTNRNAHKANMLYLRKLFSIFPDALDSKLLK